MTQQTTNREVHDLDNPFEIPGKFNSAEEFKIHFDIPKDEANFIRSLRPTKGTIQNVVSHLLQKLITQLKANGITDITKQPEFIEFVRECKIVDGRDGRDNNVANFVARELARESAPRPSEPSVPSNVNGGKTRAPRKNTKPPQQSV